MTRISLFVMAMLLAACGAVAPPPPAPPAPQAKAAESASEIPAKAAPTAPAKPAPSPKSAPAPKAPTKQKPAAPPPVAAAPPLDLKGLEQRLKDTAAIGVMTKLALKNQVDDLVAQFRTYHEGRRPPTLPELRRPFEMLLMKVLSLLQDKDAALARDINASRDAIWGVLSDRDKLAKFI
jgi:hypothetical protein